MAVELVPIDQLRLPNDETAIPLFRHDPYLIAEYAAAMRLYEGWGEFPPIVTDQEFLVLSGCTRVQAALASGLVALVPTDVVECDDDSQRVLIASEGNATSGQRWARKDLTKIALTAERVGLPTDQLARALRVKVERIERLPITTVRRYGAATAATDRTEWEERVYAKRAVRQAVRDRVLSAEEEAVMRSITTPNTADLILRDLLRLDRLNALPVLTRDSYRDARAVLGVVDAWLERDRHLIEAV